MDEMCGRVCCCFVLLFNEYLITSMFPLHIPGQQLTVKFENDCEG